MLEREEERQLARRWREEGDEEALHRLVESHIRLVVKIAQRYRKSGMPFHDLVQEGNVGLMEAAARFDPEYDNRFATYASWWIASMMQSYIMRNRSMVRPPTTPDRKRIFFNLRRLRASSTMNPNDTFQVIDFGSRANQLFERPQLASPSAKSRESSSIDSARRPRRRPNG